MAPIATATDGGDKSNGNTASGDARNGYIKAPLKLTGVLEKKFKYEDTTPVIGREFFDANIVDDILSVDGQEGEDLLRDLAITISQRGVVFFRAQNNLTNDLQKKLVQRLGEVSGKPPTSTLHIHPILNDTSEFGVGDAEISTISSLQRKKFFNNDISQADKRKYEAAKWHSDIQFETCPADYTSLRLVQLPTSGGDTLWASGYELYDRFSKPFQKFLDGLSAAFIGDGFIRAAEQQKFSLYEKPRGSPENIGRHLRAVHPVVRTNPVTGWKSIFSVGSFPKYIEGLTASESEELLEKFLSVVERNHDLQVRFKWRNQNDIAIWDNRSAFHSATFDYDGLGERFGNRAVGIGERPYFDPHSKSRSEALAEDAAGPA